MKKIMSIIATVLIGLSAQSQLPHQYELYEFEGIEYKNVYMWQESPAVPIYRGHDTMYIGYYVDTFDLSRVVRFVLPGTTNQYVRGDGSFAAFPSDNIETGKDTISGVNAMTSYAVAHNFGYIPSVVTLSPRSADAAADCYISAIDSNTFTITFTNQPPVGTDNIIFDWVAIKP